MNMRWFKKNHDRWVNSENKEVDTLKEEIKGLKVKRQEKELARREKVILYCTQNNMTATAIRGLEDLIHDKGPGHHELPEELHDLLRFKRRLGKTTAKND